MGSRRLEGELQGGAPLAEKELLGCAAIRIESEAVLL